MKSWKLAVFAAVMLLGPPRASAQSIDITLQDVQFSNPSVRIGQDYTLKAGEVARQVVVIAGDATIEGRVDRDVVVVFGKVQLASTAVVDGSFVVVGGTAVVAEGAQVHEDLFVLGGYEGAPGFSPGGQHVVIGTSAIGAWFRGMVPWLTHGLLWGRPIVPWLPWVWTVAGIFFLVNLLLNVVFDTPVRATAVTLRATPLTAFMTGILVMLLAGPVCFLLAVSLIGIAVIPFVLCALLLSALLGKVAFARWIGMSVIRQDDPENRAHSFRSFLIGSAIMCIAYMIPVLGLVTWTMAGVFGLGASTLAFFSAYRRENPKKPKAPRVPAVPVAAVVPATQNLAAEAGSYASAPGRADSREHPLAVPLQEATPQPSPSEQSGFRTADQQSAFRTADQQSGLRIEDQQSGFRLQPEGLSDQQHAFRLQPEGTDRTPGVPVHSEGVTEPAPAGLITLPRAPFVDRLGALALDVVLLLILAQVWPWRHYDDQSMFVLLSLVYHVGFWTWKSTTLGGIICQLRVVRTDGAPVQFAEALVRGLTGIFSLAVVGLGFLWILRDPERQAWHDRVAGTYVVKVPRNWPI